MCEYMFFHIQPIQKAFFLVFFFFFFLFRFLSYVMHVSAVNMELLLAVCEGVFQWLKLMNRY